MYLQSEVFFGLLTLLQLLQTIDKVCVKKYLSGSLGTFTSETVCTEIDGSSWILLNFTANAYFSWKKADFRERVTAVKS